MSRKANTKSVKVTKRRASTLRFAWNDVVLSVPHQPDYISKGWDHTELRVAAPKGAILPITETGYLSHLIVAHELVAAGGPVVLFTEWLERESKAKKWKAEEIKSRQGDLFKSG